MDIDEKIWKFVNVAIGANDVVSIFPLVIYPGADDQCALCLARTRDLNRK